MSAREIARAAGARFFTADAPCRHGHAPIRTVSEGKCFECVRVSWAKVRLRLGKKPRVPNYARIAAKAAGEARFFDGTPCPKGHIVDRWTVSGSCVTCSSLAAAKHNKENDSARRWQQANPERASDHRRAAKARRRVREAGGGFTAGDVAAILKAQRRRCAWCAVKLEPGYHVDHVQPLARGGRNERRNLQVLCPPCNRRKSWRDPVVFAQAEGRLL